MKSVEENFQDLLSQAKKVKVHTSEVEAEIESIRSMVSAAIDRGVPVKWHEQVFRDLMEIYGAEYVISDLRKFYEDMIVNSDKTQ